MTPTFSPGDRVRLRESVEVYGLKEVGTLRVGKGFSCLVKGMFRGNVEVRVMSHAYTVTLPARLLERC